MEIEMSALPKTWILDLDGTIVRHNGYKVDGTDSLLEGVDSLLSQIKENDMVVFITSRKRECKEMTEHFLDEHGIRYDYIIYGAPYGERILVNDRKPSGLKMAYAINTNRDEACADKIEENPAL
ncbi:MAG: hypothetical protein K2I96_15835 [Lachnospiraceae bacterium]|nr:hypothetical protein [Lachnospiraceae bacterium]